MLAEKKALGLESKRHLLTLTKLCRRLNGSDPITKQQFIGLFDGSLLCQSKQIKRADS